MAKLKYTIEFTEEIEDVSDLEYAQLEQIKAELKNKIHTYLVFSGLSITDDIKLDFDLIGDEDIETW